jgi:ring-1,2-phenylacetyl-CoA epoxidase subunit PaaE
VLKFHPLAIAGRTPVADDAFALSFKVPGPLRDEFSFHAGQHVALRLRIDGQDQRRTYSIVNPEAADQLTIGIRVQKGGRMSEHLARTAAIGETIDVLTPNGSFHADTSARGPRSFAAFAAGSGITPVLSIVATALERDPGNRVQLYYGNTSTARAMFLEEVLALKDRFMTRLSVSFVLSREPQDVEWFNGRIDAAKIREFARHDLDVPAIDEFFICGPGTMGEDLQAALAGLGAKGRMHVEYFVPESRVVAPVPVPASRPAAAIPAAGAEITVVMDGRRRRFSMPLRGEAILDAAGRAGLDLPFSCRAGVCSTCRAKLVSGTAEMERNVALEDWEVEAGYILCCQARPTSAVLEISYDE